MINDSLFAVADNQFRRPDYGRLVTTTSRCHPPADEGSEAL